MSWKPQPNMSWKPLRGSSKATTPGGLPGQRGRYLIYLGPPLLHDGPRWCTFVYRGESFCIRDYLGGQELRQEPGLTASDIWRTAIKKIPATGEYFHPADDVDWWTEALMKLPPAR